MTLPCFIIIFSFRNNNQMATYTATPFYYTRSNNETMRASVSTDMPNRLKAWQNDHMYRTSTYNQSLYNVSYL
jgi:hypothetical protein